MSDLFHESVEWNALFAVWQMMGMLQRHIFIVLTKRPERAYKELSRMGNLAVHLQRQSWCGIEWPFPNVWLGVSAENQQRANERIPVLMRIPAAKRVVSFEPLLGPVDMATLTRPAHFDTQPYGWDAWWPRQISWVIAGPENGAGKRPYRGKWIEDLARQCADASVPFYDKREDFSRREWPV